MFEFLFLDLDDTILDFHKAEGIALRKTLRQFGLEPTDAICNRYSQINREHWQRLERREITREQVLLGRFQCLFAEMGMQVDPGQCAATYEGCLSQGHYFLPGALDALEKLSRRYRLFLASNGTARVQNSRLDSAGIRGYFENIFISQEMGADKPSPEYFHRCFERIPGFAPERALMVGDSLSSDILGGIQSGMATCWINPRGQQGSLQPDYELQSIVQLPELLETLQQES